MRLRCSCLAGWGRGWVLSVPAGDGASSWHGPTSVSLPGDRPIYAAPAISPAGDRAYVVYDAVTSPWRGAT